MTKTQIDMATRALAIDAILAGKSTNGAVTARRVDMKRKPGKADGGCRVVWSINGNRCSRKDAARFLSA